MKLCQSGTTLLRLTTKQRYFDYIHFVHLLLRRALEVLHHPEGHGPSHSGIHNLLPDADIIADLIAEIVVEIYPAVNQITS